MKRRRARLLAIESAIANANVMLRLLEPQDSCPETLRAQVYAGTYNKPFVVDNGRRRFLHFDFWAVQSAMELNNPERLALAYTRKMMAFLLFNGAPERILQLGLGGGSLAKFCYYNLPAASITAVEVNQDVITLRDEFSIPPDNHRFRVINTDGANYISQPNYSEDVILADACDREGIATALDSIEFYRMARQRLSADGVFVTNLCGDPKSIDAHLTKLRDAFGEDLLTLPVRKDGNIVVFGFSENRPAWEWDRIEAGAADLKRRFRLDFPGYARLMALDSNLVRHQSNVHL